MEDTPKRPCHNYRAPTPAVCAEQQKREAVVFGEPRRAVVAACVSRSVAAARAPHPSCRGNCLRRASRAPYKHVR